MKLQTKPVTWWWWRWWPVM